MTACSACPKSTRLTASGKTRARSICGVADPHERDSPRHVLTEGSFADPVKMDGRRGWCRRRTWGPAWPRGEDVGRERDHHDTKAKCGRDRGRLRRHEPSGCKTPTASLLDVCGVITGEDVTSDEIIYEGRHIETSRHAVDEF